MKHAFLAACAAMALGGCFHGEEATAENRAIAYCEELVQFFVSSPSTYQRADAHVLETKGSLRPVGPRHPGALDVSLSFDAANAFGTPVRNRAKCRFALSPYGSLDLTAMAVEDKAAAESAMENFKMIVSLKELDHRHKQERR
ncbi:MAG TPA: hypothetical protein VHG92_08520 [Afifellaceae bacterium]|nr:hypothetical protein [Afifellaceae bacterium]